MARVRPFSALLALLLPLLAARTGHAGISGPPYGYPACRCATSARVGAPSPGYGIGCKAHDNRTDPRCTPAPLPAECVDVSPTPAHCDTAAAVPAWCEAEWCYVADPSTCTLSLAQSFFFSGDYYSYAACGFLDRFSTDPVKDELRGRVLKVGFRSNSGGWLGAYHPGGNAVPTYRDHQWHGALVQFVSEVSETAGFVVNITDAPAQAYAQLGDNDTYTQCVYATSLGFLDFCVSMLTLTDERAVMAPFFTMDTVQSHLVVRAESPSKWDRAFTAFEPFTPGAWGVVVGCAVFLGATTYWMERGEGGAFSSGRAEDEVPMDPVRGVLYAAYVSFRGLLGGAVEFQPVTWEGRLMAVGMGLFVLLIISLYGANLTTLLVVDASPAHSIGSIQDVIAQGSKICTTSFQADAVRKHYPRVRFEIHEDRHESLVLVSKGLCAVSLSFMEDVQAVASEGVYCNLLPLANPLGSVYRGMPMHTSVAKPLSYHMQSAINAGVWERIKLEDFTKHLPLGCEASGGGDDDDLTLDVADVSGALLLSVCTTALAGAVALAHHRKKLLSLGRRCGGTVVSTPPESSPEQGQGRGPPPVKNGELPPLKGAGVHSGRLGMASAHPVAPP